jgi:predicted DNA-binding WGR domain protein
MNGQPHPPVRHDAPGTLRTLIQAQAGAPLPTDDVLVLLVPLFEQVAALHAQGKVAALGLDSVLVDQAGALALHRPDGEAPAMDIGEIHRVQPHPATGLNIIGTLQREGTEDGSREVTDAALQLDCAAPIERPVYLPGPLSWELLVGHHDEIGDIFLLGMTLASLACGLDFTDENDLRRFVAHRRNLFQIDGRLHPIVASVIVEMTEINRHDRATDVSALATRLRTWREQPLTLDVERALAGASGAASRRTAVLTHLRDRLFDLSRRNRLLYFRPSAANVNLTVASVPLMLQIQSVRPEHICTWGGPFAADLVAGQPVPLQRWLRFDDQPYLPAALDRLIAGTRRERAEFGFSNLRLVVAFLRWHNLKEAPDERIVTPLLWLPVELVKRKGVRDQYVVQCAAGDAEFNPVLRHHLNQLYGIQLAETVDLGKTSLADIHADIAAQIHGSEPSVELRLVDKASIRLVRQKALKRMQQFKRRKPGVTVRARSGSLPPYSYAQDGFRPLGRALFEQWVRPSDLPQRFEAGAAPRASLRQPNMSDAAVLEEDRQGFVLEEAEGHRYAWDIDLTQVTLANFNYRKMSLVRDYAQLIDEPGINPAFDRVFSIEPRQVETDAPAVLAAADQWNVIAADATQNMAVGLARQRRSFIIQGPPGTGKSQTITNLIADFSGRGKRVLFVCEKRAALDVVFHRLKQSGLAPLCCLIHDSQADKKAFIADLRACYEQWIAKPHDSEALIAQRAQIVESLVLQQQRIDGFESAMADLPEALGTTVRALLRRLSELGAAPPAGPALRECLPTLAAWDASRDLTQRVHRAMKERFGLNSLAAHPFARISSKLLDDERAFSRVEQLCNDIEALFDSLDPVFESALSLIVQHSSLEEARAIATDSQLVIDHNLASHLNLLDPDSPAQVELTRVKADMETRAQAQRAALDATANWRDKLSAGDTESALAITQRLEHSAARWLQPAWWRLRGQLKQRYDFSKHAVHPGYGNVLQALAAEHKASAAMSEAEADCRRRYGVDDMNAFLRALGELNTRLAAQSGLRMLIAHLRNAVDPVATALAQAHAREALDKLASRIGDGMSLAADTRLADIAEHARDLREALDDLPDLLPLLRAVHAADPAYAAALQMIDHAPAQFEALVADEALRRLERTNPTLARFNGAALAQSVRAVADGQRALLALNAQVVQATQHRQFAEHVRHSALSATQLDSEGKAFKKVYSTGRRELEHEFSKTMRHRSIRDLSDDETGAVINDLKPIWLMSPLSVSDTLPLSPDLFDVVIFDEASQIPTEEAVPAMSRASQVVVVGDEMQLPPTSFFSSGGAEADDEIFVEEDGERIAINLDADSLLNQAARNLPATLLAWHYRSRHESLISFSNAAFYGGRLVTIPDRMLETVEDEARALRSDREDAGIAGADALLKRPVSFHQLGDGVYLERRNEPEARYIAQTVRELLRRETGLSIGIVAFSEAQQGSIESALDALASEDADFAARLEREYVREDDDQFNGLFVKNLENVQGDERDVIILSICYGPGPDGKMLMNFGPINQRGGEKRLNVIFSRARHRMAVVSTIHADAITNVHNDGAAALRTFLQFAQASANGQFERAQAVLGGINPGARDTFARQAPADPIRDALVHALKARGHQVQVNVGRSQFRCDLAIADPSGQGYALAILLDAPSDSVTDTVERYVFRPGILRSFGWRVLDIPGKDWLTDAPGVLTRIEAMLADGEDRALSVTIEPLTDLRASRSASLTDAVDPGVGSVAAPTIREAATAQVVRTLRFEQGSSGKFWRASLRDTELTVSYGRIGSNGQVNRKEFDTPERARREMDKLVAEKLRKGYVEE